MEMLQGLLKKAHNTIENPSPSDDYQNSNEPPLGGGGQNVIPPGEDGDDGMDPWQTSVESRLGGLDRRLSSIETGVGEIKVNIATIDTTVKHLPSKGFIVTAVVGGATLLGVVGHYFPKLLTVIGG